jgi:hypothetical protein
VILNDGKKLNRRDIFLKNDVRGKFAILILLKSDGEYFNNDGAAIL